MVVRWSICQRLYDEISAGGDAPYVIILLYGKEDRPMRAE